MAAGAVQVQATAAAAAVPQVEASWPLGPALTRDRGCATKKVELEHSLTRMAVRPLPMHRQAAHGSHRTLGLFERLLTLPLCSCFVLCCADRYVGQWLHDKKHYQGVYTYANMHDALGRLTGREAQLGRLMADGGSNVVAAAAASSSSSSYANHDRYEGEFLHGLMHGSGVYTYANGDEISGRWQRDVQDGLSVFKGADGSLREEQWEAGERMTSKLIGSADPLAISAVLDAERVKRKVSQDTAQFHLIKKTTASEHGGLATVSPRIAPPPQGARTHTPAEIMEQLAAMQLQNGAASSAATSTATAARRAASIADIPENAPRAAFSSSAAAASSSSTSSSDADSSTDGAIEPAAADAATVLATPSHATAAAHHAQNAHHTIEHDVTVEPDELIDVED